MVYTNEDAGRSVSSRDGPDLLLARLAGSAQYPTRHKTSAIGHHGWLTDKQKGCFPYWAVHNLRSSAGWIRRHAVSTG